MKRKLRLSPSSALVISIIALVLAASGTAVAASKLVSGNSLIKVNSLSGDRLKAGFYASVSSGATVTAICAPAATTTG